MRKATFVGLLALGLSAVGCGGAGDDAGSDESALGANTTYVKNLTDGVAVRRSLLADLGRAEREIDVSMFLFFNDPSGREVADALIARASDRARPVKVRVMMDLLKTRFGAPFTADAAGLAARLRAGGVEVVDTNVDYDRPAATGHPEWDAEGARIARQVLDAFDVLHTDHRKLVVIDGRIVYLGSANLGREYLYSEPFDRSLDAAAEAEARRARGLPEAWEKWHDGLVRFEGGALGREVVDVFRQRWVLDGGRDFAPVTVARAVSSDAGEPVRAARLVTGAPNGQENPVKQLFVEQIRAAKTSIFIENPYFYHPDVIDALVDARAKNPRLRVDLVMPAPALNDSAQSARAQVFRYPRLVAMGVAVHEYQHHFSHLKIATFDERRTIVGSANLNYRSLERDRDFEIAALVDCAPLARSVNADVRDVDVRASRSIGQAELDPSRNPEAWKYTTRDPLTFWLENAREL